MTIYGKGVRPLPVTALRAGDGPAAGNCYFLPNDVAIRWGYRKAPGPPGSGAGYMAAGQPVLARAPCDGTLLLNIYDADDALVRAEALPLDQTGEFIYTHVQIKEDFGLSTGYSPGAGILNLSNTATSPAPTEAPGDIPSCGGSSGSSNWTAFTPSKLLHEIGANASGSVFVSTSGCRGALFILDGGLVTSPPTGLFILRVRFTNVTGSAAFQLMCVVLCRFNEDNELQETQGLTQQDNTVLNSGATYPHVREWTGTVSSWSSWAATDRLGVNIAFLNQGANTGTIFFDLNDGESRLTNEDVGLPGVDFSVEAIVSKDGMQSPARTIDVANLGGTTL